MDIINTKQNYGFTVPFLGTCTRYAQDLRYLNPMSIATSLTIAHKKQ